MSRMPVVLIALGVLAGVTGVVVMHVAAARREYAEGVAEFSRAMSGYASPAEVESAVLLGRVGLVLLIAGAASMLVGIVVAAHRRNC